MSKPNLSVAIATYNEENNIKRCLDSLIDLADEIIIVDGDSTDNTVNVAKSFKKTKIIKTDNKPMFHLNKQMAIDACKGNWILQLDADEVVSPKLKEEILSVVTKDISQVQYNGYWIKRKNYFLTSFLKKGGVYPDPTIRLYKNGSAKLPCQSVHEQAVVNGPVGHLAYDLEHYADPTFSRYLTRNNRYTTLMAQEMLDQKLSLNTINFLSYYLFKPMFWFLSTYFRHKGFFDGFPGFVFSLFSALRFPIAYTKYWELKHGRRKLNMSSDWDK